MYCYGFAAFICLVYAKIGKIPNEGGEKSHGQCWEVVPIGRTHQN